MTVIKEGARHRESDDRFASTYQGAFWTTPASPVYNTASRAKSLGSYRSMDDYVTANFKSLVARGVVINNPMQKSETHYSSSDTGFVAKNTIAVPGQTQTWVQTSGVIQTQLGPPGHFPFGSYDSLVAEVSTRARARVAASTATGLVSIAELPKTIRMIAKPAMALRIALEKFQRKHNVSIVDAVSGLWLEGRYGWRPFFYDVEQWLEALGKVYPERETARAMQVLEQSATNVYYPSLNTGAIPLVCQHTDKRTVTVSAGILFQNDAIFDAQRALGFRLSDVPGAILELVPYSFVANWAFNVSHVVNALTPRGGISQLATWTTTKIESETTREAVGTTVVGGVPGWSLQAPITGTSVTKTKSTFRTPSLALPSLVLKQSATQWTEDLRALDAVALVFNALASAGVKFR